VNQERRETQITEMRQAYPSLTVATGGRGISVVWEGWLQPLRGVEHLDSILDDLENDRVVEIVRGELYHIAHDTACTLPHGAHRLTPLLKAPVAMFRVRIEDYGDGRLPLARVLEPEIPLAHRRHHRGPDGICSFAPWEYPWDPEASSMVEFTDHALIWLLKQTVFSQTKEWLGSETAHDPAFLLRTIKAAEQCYCGSGRPYRTCHRISNGYELFGDAWIEFEAWIAVRDCEPTRIEAVAAQVRRSIAARRPDEAVRTARA
jgi:hypothetical protein